MKSFVNYWKNDYLRVKIAMKMLSNDRLPDWAIIIWYILVLPIGLLLMPLGLLLNLYIKKVLLKM